MSDTFLTSGARLSHFRRRLRKGLRVLRDIISNAAMGHRQKPLARSSGTRSSGTLAALIRAQELGIAPRDYNEALEVLLQQGAMLNGSLVYDAQMFASYLSAARRHLGCTPERTLQIGPGYSLGCEMLLCLAGVRQAWSLDPFPLLDFDIVRYAAQLEATLRVVHFFDGLSESAPIPHGAMPFRAMPFRLPSCRAIGPQHYQVGAGEVRHHAGRFFEATGLKSESVDFLFSNACLEHVQDPIACLRETHRLLRNGRVTAHQIDLRDHRNFAQPLNFLQESATQWQQTLAQYCSHDPSIHLNRWRAGQYRAAFAECGLQIVEWTVNCELPASRLAPERALLAPEFAALPDADLTTLGLFVVARKT